MAHPECCCGYTLDQAAFLESEIRRCHPGLAPSINRSSANSSEDIAGHSHLVLQIQSYELALTANLLMLRVHAPFLRVSSPSPPTSQFRPAKSTSQLNAHSAEMTISAAQSILRTARSLHGVLSSSMPSPISPSILDFYPLEKLVLDSIIICANPGLSTKLLPSSSTWMFDTSVLIDDVISGLDLLSELRVMTEPHRRIVDALSKKLSHRGTNLLKRKHDQVDIIFESQSKPDFLFKFLLKN
jgi:hypothetical protein